MNPIDKITLLVRITPNKILSLPKGYIFVFGSNTSGIHGAGAAKLAKKSFGAITGVSFGLSGESFAIPTRAYTRDRTMVSLSLQKISGYVNQFIYFARHTRPDFKFYVTEIGCGLAGYKPEEIANLFIPAVTVDNIFLPETFWKIIYGV